MDLKNNTICYVCGNKGAWIFIVDKTVCGNCFIEFKNKKERQNVVILEDLKKGDF